MRGSGGDGPDEAGELRDLRKYGVRLLRNVEGPNQNVLVREWDGNGARYVLFCGIYQ
jgi:hypothetical protein